MKKLQILVLVGSLLAAQTAFSGERKLVEGAGTLEGGDFAISLNLGLDYPEPLIYGLRFDAGIGKRFQLGIGGTAVPIDSDSFLITAGLYSKFNFWRSENEANLFSFYFDPFVLLFPDSLFDEDAGQSKTVTLYMLKPGFTFEHLFGEEKRTSVYLKAGTVHFLAASASGKFVGANFRSGTFAMSVAPGLQHNFGGTFSVALEPKVYIALQDVDERFGFAGKLALSWTF
ncbi:MAG: hypothetical protein Q7S68_01320 [Deltaproteobacteria bacterium]|nr:hypothetical protein [Deltaproteobacteria bacterium]